MSVIKSCCSPVEEVVVVGSIGIYFVISIINDSIDCSVTAVSVCLRYGGGFFVIEDILPEVKDISKAVLYKFQQDNIN